MKARVLGFCAAWILGVALQTEALAEGMTSKDVLDKLQTISEKQDQILQELENIKSELNIVKIRATLNS